jgi:protein-tyrosine phosphatase
MSVSFDFITKRLATGGAIGSAADVQTLKDAGISAVIDCRDDQDDGPLLATSGLIYLWNPTADDGQPKGPDWFGRSLSFALPLLSQPHHKVLCHCAAGINRGPSTAYCLMIALGFSPAWCRAEIILHRPVCVAGVRYADDAEVAVKALGYV